MKNAKLWTFFDPVSTADHGEAEFANHALYGEGGGARTNAMYGLLNGTVNWAIAPKHQPMQVTVPVHIGNRHVVTHVVNAIAKSMDRPNTGSSNFNPSMSRPSVAGGH